MKNKKGLIASALPDWLAWPLLIIVALIFFILFVFLRGCSNTEPGQILETDVAELNAEYMLSYFLELPWETGNVYDQKTMTDLIIEAENDDTLQTTLKQEMFNFFFPNYYWAWSVFIYYPSSTINNHFTYDAKEELANDYDNRKQALINRIYILRISASDRFEKLEDELIEEIEGVASDINHWDGDPEVTDYDYLSETYSIARYIPVKDNQPIKVVFVSHFIPKRNLYTNIII
jgi:hypothetical protein